jgi:hypothetical protein
MAVSFFSVASSIVARRHRPSDDIRPGCCDIVENLRRLVVVGEDDRVARALRVRLTGQQGRRSRRPGRIRAMGRTAAADAARRKTLPQSIKVQHSLRPAQRQRPIASNMALNVKYLARCSKTHATRAPTKSRVTKPRYPANEKLPVCVCVCSQHRWLPDSLAICRSRSGLAAQIASTLAL